MRSTRCATKDWFTPASAPARTSRSRLLLRTATRPHHIPGLADRFPTIRSAAPRRRIAGGWIPVKRSEPWDCPRGRRPTETRFDAREEQIGDAILARKDAPASYHLSCVVDDAASGVTMVVRGADLRPSTPIQRLLQVLLGLPEPTYLHHPLVTHEDGRRLAKRDLAPTLAAMREAGVDGRRLASELLAGKLPLGFAFSDA